MATTEMRVRGVKGIPGVGVVLLEGSLDFRNVEALRRAFAGARVRGLRSFVLDLARVRYINSTGLSCLVALSDLVQSGGGSLGLANPQPKVKVVFELMGLAAMFPLHGSVAAAVRHAAASGSKRRRGA